MDHTRFSMMWVNDATTHQRPMSSCRMTLRDAGGDAEGQTLGGLTCAALYLDQVVVQFRPTTSIGDAEFQNGDTRTRNWSDVTTDLYVRTSPGRRSVCYTLGSQDTPPQVEHGSVQPKVKLVYTTALHATPDVGMMGAHTRTYRPLRDLPVATFLDQVSELSVDLLWPLLQGGSSDGLWYVPNYRIERILCDFTARIA